MKHSVLFLLLISFCSYLSAQESKAVKLSSDIESVTVFMQNAQIFRSKKYTVPAGESLICFKQLSPYIDAKSIQLKTSKKLTILSIDLRKTKSAEALQKEKELNALYKKAENIQDKIDGIKLQQSILTEEMDFLNENKNIGGKEQSISAAALRELTAYYAGRMKELILAQDKYKTDIANLAEKKQVLHDQIDSVTKIKTYYEGEIYVKVKADAQSSTKFELSYIVANASWYPSYDITSVDITEPIRISYKANIKQDTRVDWKQVPLTLSTADPNISGIAPELQAYRLGYNMRPPSYKKTIKTVSGVVYDDSDGGLPLIGCNVVVKGTTIGTVTDFDGRYTISIPNENSILVYSYIGMQTQEIPVNSETINVHMKVSSMRVQEVVMSSKRKRKARYSLVAPKGIAESASEGAYADFEIADDDYNSIISTPQATQKQLAATFEINIPYSVYSDNTVKTVSMAEYELPTEYQYFSVPKIEPAAYLTATITGWEAYNFLEGEATVFFENTYVGKTILNTRSLTDTLSISLGQDRNVIVKRTKAKDFSQKQFIGTKRQVAKAWNIEVKNSKQVPIQMRIEDQIPVSTNEDITVELKEKSGAKLNPETGILNWEFALPAGASEQFDLQYSVKFPKNRKLVVE